MEAVFIRNVKCHKFIFIYRRQVLHKSYMYKNLSKHCIIKES